jgi:hypothetical protein
MKHISTSGQTSLERLYTLSGLSALIPEPWSRCKFGTSNPLWNVDPVTGWGRHLETDGWYEVADSGGCLGPPYNFWKTKIRESSKKNYSPIAASCLYMSSTDIVGMSLSPKLQTSLILLHLVCDCADSPNSRLGRHIRRAGCLKLYTKLH